MEIWNEFELKCENKRPRIFLHTSSSGSIGIETKNWAVELSKADLVRIVKLLPEINCWTEPKGEFDTKFVKL